MRRAAWGLVAGIVALQGVAGATTPARPPDAAATPAPTVVFRCTAPSGAVALQDDPCPAGHRQERREMAAFAPPSPAPAPVVPETSAATPPPEAPPPSIQPAMPAPAPALLLPPPLWRCTDLNGHTRLAEAYDPQPRCVPLSVLGVDLSRAPPSAATLCRTIEDECVELGGEAACAAWQERLDAAESALRTAFSDTQAQRRRERDRAKSIIENDCRP